MEIANPEKVIKAIYPNFSVNQMLGIDFDKLTAAAESMGYRSANFIGNSATYIMFAILAIIVNIIVLLILYGGRHRLKA